MSFYPLPPPSPLPHTDSLNTDVKRTLRDYETTLKNQTAHIEDLKRENEVAVLQNEELTQQCSDLELRVSRVCAAREAHSSRVEELTNSLDGECRPSIIVALCICIQQYY